VEIDATGWRATHHSGQPRIAVIRRTHQRIAANILSQCAKCRTGMSLFRNMSFAQEQWLRAGRFSAFAPADRRGKPLPE
jgi:hypothetical protein